MPEGFTAAAVGLFDGVHLGHRAVISRAAEIAEECVGVSPAVFTFETDTVTSKGGGMECLLSKELKNEVIGSLGVEYIYSPDFMNFKNLSAEGFVELVLCGKMSARFVVCGEDFRFGRGASGDVHTLERLCMKKGIRVFTVPPVKGENGERISSTEIRELIRNGEISRANRLLGYKYFMRLPVVGGNHIGRTMDFPTINQQLPKGQVMPKFGVYASAVQVNEKMHRGVTNIGVKPTVSCGGLPLAETFIEDFEGDLYGERIRLSLVEFIRPERKFSGISELAEQIKTDVRACAALPDDIYGI